MSRQAMHWAISLLAGTLLLTTGGCGAKPGPGATVPQLETTLSQVDESIAGRNWERAHRAVQELIVQTGAALEAGTLTQEQADRIQAAAARLLSELPEPPPQVPSPPVVPPDPEVTLDDTEDFEEKEEDKREAVEEKREEDKEQRDKDTEERREEEEEQDEDHE